MTNILQAFRDYFYAKRELARLLKIVYPEITPLDSLSGLVSQVDNCFAVPLLQHRAAQHAVAGDAKTARLNRTLGGTEAL